MRDVTDDDRALFPGLSDEQIAAIIAHDGELEDDHYYDLTDYLARMVDAFGWDGCREYVRLKYPDGRLTADDMEELLSRVEYLRAARLATLRITILQACDPQSNDSAHSRESMIKDIIKDLE